MILGRVDIHVDRVLRYSSHLGYSAPYVIDVIQGLFFALAFGIHHSGDHGPDLNLFHWLVVENILV